MFCVIWWFLFQFSSWCSLPSSMHNMFLWVFASSWWDCYWCRRGGTLWSTLVGNCLLTCSCIDCHVCSHRCHHSWSLFSTERNMLEVSIAFCRDPSTYHPFWTDTHRSKYHWMGCVDGYKRLHSDHLGLGWRWSWWWSLVCWQGIGWELVSWPLSDITQILLEWLFVLNIDAHCLWSMHTLFVNSVYMDSSIQSSAHLKLMHMISDGQAGIQWLQSPACINTVK